MRKDFPTRMLRRFRGQVGGVYAYGPRDTWSIAREIKCSEADVVNALALARNQERKRKGQPL